MDHLIRTVNERILERMEDGEELKFCFFCPGGVPYCTRKVFLEEIRSQGRFLEVFRSPRRVFMVITKGKLDRLKRGLKMQVDIIDQERIYWDVLLISNR